MAHITSGRYQVERTPDETLRFRRPDGCEVCDVPPPALAPADPVGSLREDNVEHGLEIDARTNLAGWLGERLDLAYAMDVLHPRARQSALTRWEREEVPKIERGSERLKPEDVSSYIRTRFRPAG